MERMMTEAAWLTCTDLGRMLRCLDGKVSMRKMRLFAIACCQRVQFLLIDVDEPGGCQALDLAKRMVEERVSSREVSEVRSSAGYASFRLIDGYRQEPDRNARSFAIGAALGALQESDDPTWYAQAWDDSFMRTPQRAQKAAAFASGAEAYSPEWDNRRHREEIAQIQTLRDIVGNPFRKVGFDPSWLDWNEGAVKDIARAIYDAQAFDRMPRLRDALVTGGCTSADILDHCRLPGEHVRGCWVIDLLLGKT